jgi:predicted ester cyclase
MGPLVVDPIILAGPLARPDHRHDEVYIRRPGASPETSCTRPTTLRSPTSSFTYLVRLAIVSGRWLIQVRRMAMEHPNAQLLRRAWAAYERGDVEAFAACLTDDWPEYGPGGSANDYGTLEGERPTMETHRSAFPDKHTEIHQIVADDDMVACHCTVTATQTGRYLELEPTGKTVVVHEMMFNRVHDGRLVITWALSVGPGFHEQLSGGAAPEGVEDVG